MDGQPTLREMCRIAAAQCIVCESGAGSLRDKIPQAEALSDLIFLFASGASWRFFQSKNTT